MINSFNGEYRFLSNFWPAPVVLNGMMFDTVEAAYQAAKTHSREERLAIKNASTPGKAKRLGKTITMREDWLERKLPVMEFLLRQKFRHPEMQALLLNTGDEELQEGNTWGDTYWGVCNGKGENHLGKLLMKIRSELRG